MGEVQRHPRPGPGEDQLQKMVEEDNSAKRWSYTSQVIGGKPRCLESQARKVARTRESQMLLRLIKQGQKSDSKRGTKDVIRDG